MCSLLGGTQTGTAGGQEEGALWSLCSISAALALCVASVLGQKGRRFFRLSYKVTFLSIGSSLFNYIEMRYLACLLESTSRFQIKCMKMVTEHITLNRELEDTWKSGQQELAKELVIFLSGGSLFWCL